MKRKLSFLPLLVVFAFLCTATEILSAKGWSLALPEDLTPFLPGPVPRPVQPYPREAFVFPHNVFQKAHASSLVELENGDILITWFAGSGEAKRDVNIYSARYSPGSDSCTEPQVVVRKGEKVQGTLWPDKSLGNTSLYLDDENFLWMFYNSIVIGGWSGAVINYTVSRDMGGTWSKPRRLVNSLGNLVRSKPLRLDSNTFLLPCYTELFTHKGYVKKIKHRNGKIISKGRASRIPQDGAIQPALALTEDGSILMLLRDRAKKGIRRSWSFDQGKTWSDLDLIGLPNPNSAVALANLDDGRIMLVYNHSSDGRTPLSIAVSEDNGKTFRRVRDLETKPGRYSYPSVIQTRDSLIHVTYTYNSDTIKHVTFDKSWLREQPGPR